jgi:hypothetical protein
MPKSEQFEQKAVECLRLARVMMDSTNKALLHQMALAWIERANQIRGHGTNLRGGCRLFIEQKRVVTEFQDLILTEGNKRKPAPPAGPR